MRLAVLLLSSALAAPAMAGSLYELAGDNWYGGLGLAQRSAQGSPLMQLQVREVPALSGGYRWDERHSLSLQLVPTGRRMGLAVSYDWPRYFVRLAYDPKANFMPQDTLRLSAGVRF
ncbi:MAG: hypothetical protein HYX47_03105 [Burkholderiales bacterium]|nr:hypothetical protein [Burkholderiales bacterium]